MSVSLLRKVRVLECFSGAFSPDWIAALIIWKVMVRLTLVVFLSEYGGYYDYHGNIDLGR